MAAPSKSALSLLSAYDSDDSSEDDSPTLQIKSKRCVPEKWTEAIRSHLETQNKLTSGRYKIMKVCILPLPSALMTNLASSDTTMDNPTLHDGRVRSFPHVRGNWSTYIYIPYEVTPSVQSFIDVIEAYMADVVDLKLISDLHISLTRTVVLRHHWIDSFVKTVQEHVKYFHRFQVSFGAVQVYHNEEKTRSFVGLQVTAGEGELRELIKVLDNSLSEFRLPPYYKDPSFHLSVGWALGDVTPLMKTKLPQLDIALQQMMGTAADQWDIPVSQLLCKTGNKHFSFHLAS